MLWARECLNLSVPEFAVVCDALAAKRWHASAGKNSKLARPLLPSNSTPTISAARMRRYFQKQPPNLKPDDRLGHPRSNHDSRRNQEYISDMLRLERYAPTAAHWSE